MLTLFGKPVSDEILLQVKNKISKLNIAGKRLPKLAVILVGEDPASQIYVRKKTQAANELGIQNILIQFSLDVSPDEVLKQINILNSDLSVDGILLQRPLPSSFQKHDVSLWITPEKDVDCFHPYNLGKLMTGDLGGIASCTPKGIISLLDYYKIPLEGSVVCVVGRSTIVGRPLAQLLINRNATVIQCHSKTKNLSKLTHQADIVILAAGVPECFDFTYFNKKSIVIDVGIHKKKDGRLTGDVKTDGLSGHVHALSPVPGGVGPLTIATLMENTVECYELYETKKNRSL